MTGTYINKEGVEFRVIYNEKKKRYEKATYKELRNLNYYPVSEIELKADLELNILTKI